jgi:hypothetical protein
VAEAPPKWCPELFGVLRLFEHQSVPEPVDNGPTEVACLGHVRSGPPALAVLEPDPDGRRVLVENIVDVKSVVGPGLNASAR